MRDAFKVRRTQTAGEIRWLTEKMNVNQPKIIDGKQ
jgi:hypothetical protein